MLWPRASSTSLNAPAFGAGHSKSEKMKTPTRSITSRCFITQSASTSETACFHQLTLKDRSNGSCKASNKTGPCTVTSRKPFTVERQRQVTAENMDKFPLVETTLSIAGKADAISVLLTFILEHPVQWSGCPKMGNSMPSEGAILADNDPRMAAT